MDGRDKIGTWPTPEMPVVERFGERDIHLLKDLNEVVHRHGIKGSVLRVEVGCGTPPPPKPDRDSHCIRVCFPGPDDRPHCIWICW